MNGDEAFAALMDVLEASGEEAIHTAGDGRTELVLDRYGVRRSHRTSLPGGLALTDTGIVIGGVIERGGGPGA